MREPRRIVVDWAEDAAARKRTEADAAVLRERLETTIAIGGVLLGENDRWLNQQALAAGHPGAALLARLDAAEQLMHALLRQPGIARTPELARLIDAYNALMRGD